MAKGKTCHGETVPQKTVGRSHDRNEDDKALERPIVLDEVLPFLREAHACDQSSVAVDEVVFLKLKYPRVDDQPHSIVQCTFQVAAEADSGKSLLKVWLSPGCGDVEDRAKEILAGFSKRTGIEISMDVLVRFYTSHSCLHSHIPFFATSVTQLTCSVFCGSQPHEGKPRRAQFGDFMNSVENHFRREGQILRVMLDSEPAHTAWYNAAQRRTDLRLVLVNETINPLDNRFTAELKKCLADLLRLSFKWNPGISFSEALARALCTVVCTVSIV